MISFPVKKSHGGTLLLIELCDSVSSGCVEPWICACEKTRGRRTPRSHAVFVAGVGAVRLDRAGHERRAPPVRRARSASRTARALESPSNHRSGIPARVSRTVPRRFPCCCEEEEVGGGGKEISQDERLFEWDFSRRERERLREIERDLGNEPALGVSHCCACRVSCRAQVLEHAAVECATLNRLVVTQTVMDEVRHNDKNTRSGRRVRTL